MKKRVIVIGLGAAEPTIVEDLSQRNELSHLARIREWDIFARLQNHVSYSDASGLTRTNPGDMAFLISSAAILKSTDPPT